VTHAHISWGARAPTNRTSWIPPTGFCSLLLQTAGMQTRPFGPRVTGGLTTNVPKAQWEKWEEKLVESGVLHGTMQNGN